MGSANQAISLGIKHWTNIHMKNTIVHPFTGKEMEYTVLMKDPTLKPLRKRGFGNDVGSPFPGNPRHTRNKHLFLF
jgi:hypothetical protein